VLDVLDFYTTNLAGGSGSDTQRVATPAPRPTLQAATAAMGGSMSAIPHVRPDINGNKMASSNDIASLPQNFASAVAIDRQQTPPSQRLQPVASRPMIPRAPTPVQSEVNYYKLIEIVLIAAGEKFNVK
jgi:hypothetical protein